MPDTSRANIKEASSGHSVKRLSCDGNNIWTVPRRKHAKANSHAQNWLTDCDCQPLKLIDFDYLPLINHFLWLSRQSINLGQSVGWLLRPPYWYVKFTLCQTSKITAPIAKIMIFWTPHIFGYPTIFFVESLATNGDPPNRLLFCKIYIFALPSPFQFYLDGNLKIS